MLYTPLCLFLILLPLYGYAQGCNHPDSSQAVWFRALAKNAEKQQLHDSAVFYYQRSRDFYTQVQCWGEAAKISTNLVLSAAKLPNKDLYRSELHNALILVQNQLPNTDSVKAKIYQIVGTDYLQRQNADSAIIFLQSAQAMYQAAKAWRSYVLACRSLAQAAQFKQDYQLMERFINEGFAVTQNQLNNNPEQLSAILQLYGGLYYRTGEYDKSFKNMQQGLEIARHNLKTRQDSASLVSFYNNVGLLYIELGDVYQAEGYCLNAMLLSSQMGDYFRGATIQYNLAESFKLRGDSARALQNYQKGLQLLDKSGQQSNSIYQANDNQNRVLINLRNGLAEVSPALNQYTQAVEAITANLKLHLQEPYRKEETYRILADLYQRQNQLSDAVATMQQSLDWAMKVYNSSYHPVVANAYMELGNLYQQQKQPDKALQAYDKALLALLPAQYNPAKEQLSKLPEITAIADKETYLLTLYAKAQVYFDSKQEPQKALELVNQAINLIDSYRSSVQSYSSKLFLQKKVQPIYELALQILYQIHQKNPQEQNYLQACLNLVEKNKSLLLLDALHTEQARSFGKVPANLIAQERKLSREIAQTEKELYDIRHSAAPNLVQRKQQLLLELNKSLTELQARLERDYPDYYRLKYAPNEAKLEDLRRSLNDQTALLEYFVGNKHIFVFTCTSREGRFYQISKSNQTDNALIALRTALTNNSLLQTNLKAAYYLLTKNAYTVYQQLVQPFLPAKVKNLLIISDGLLNYIPFESLLTQKVELNPNDTSYSFQNLPYLLRDYTVNYNYSASLMLLERQEIRTNGRILALAPHYKFDPNAPVAANQTQLAQIRKSVTELPGAHLELDILESLFVGDFFRDEAANERNFKLQNQLAPHSVIHLAMHGIVDNERPANSGLLMSYSRDSVEDDMLSAYELNLLDINTDLVVLSACETGFGKYERGEGVISIGRGFMYAGVPSLAMTLWSINDQATANLMAYYYQYLARSMRKDEAMRQAKLIYLERADRKTSHPFYWASFIPVGDSQPIYIAQRWTWKEYSLTVAAIAAFFALMFYIRRKV